MAIDLTTLITNLQADVDAVDSSTSMSSILSLMHKARKITSISNYYDSAGLLPVDSAYDGMLAFSKADNTVYKFVDSNPDTGSLQSWHKADSAIAATGSGSAMLQGTNYGYRLGGYAPPGAMDTVDKYSFTSDGNASDVGDLTIGRRFGQGVSGPTAVYVHGGWHSLTPISPTYVVGIDAVATASDGNATDHGDIFQPNTEGLWYHGANYSATHGYATGGAGAGIPPPTSYGRDNITKFPFAVTGGTATDVSDLDIRQTRQQTSNSTTDGYNMGGIGYDPDTSSNVNSGNYINNINKFPFASDTDGSADVGDMVNNVGFGSSNQQSTTHGYTSGGAGYPPGVVNVIQKFPFSSFTTATDVGDLIADGAPGPVSGGQRSNMSGSSSTTHGYNAGGDPPGNTINQIQKFAYASDGNATSVGDLTQAGRDMAGAQA